MPFPYAFPFAFDAAAAAVSFAFAISGTPTSDLTHPWHGLVLTDTIRQKFIASCTTATAANDQQIEIAATLLNLSRAYPSLFSILRSFDNPEIINTTDTPHALPLFITDRAVAALLLYI